MQKSYQSVRMEVTSATIMDSNGITESIHNVPDIWKAPSLIAYTRSA